MEDIYRASVKLFAAKGFAATGIREIAGALSMNSASLYHHARSGKEEILVGIMEISVGELLAIGERAIAGAVGVESKLNRLVRGHVGLVALNPQSSIVTDHETRALGATNYERIIGLRDQYERLVGDVLEEGVAQGAFQVEDVSMARLAIMEMCNGVAYWFRSDGRLNVGEVKDIFADLVFHMVRAQPNAFGHADDIDPVLLPTEPR